VSGPHVPATGSAHLGSRIAGVLRSGTLLAVSAIGVGFVLALVTGGPGPGARPVGELIFGGGPDTFTALGLMGLTLLPLGVLLVAAITFGSMGERRNLLTSLAVLVLLVASLVVAALVARAG
jgi:uncharacterized membrane protein